jgi:DNA (cytosine-5)-methyltransferase 1
MPVFGGGQLLGGNDLFEGSVAMGINWMTKAELNEAIPPAFSFHLGKQLMQHVLNNTETEQKTA